MFHLPAGGICSPLIIRAHRNARSKAQLLHGLRSLDPAESRVRSRLSRRLPRLLAPSSRDEEPTRFLTDARRNRPGHCPRLWRRTAQLGRGANDPPDQSELGISLRLLPRRLEARLQALRRMGLEKSYSGPPYSDQWTGTSTLVDVRPGEDGSVRLACDSPFWPRSGPLEITVELEGEPLLHHSVRERGRFEFRFSLPGPSTAAGATVRSSCAPIARSCRTQPASHPGTSDPFRSS